MKTGASGIFYLGKGGAGKTTIAALTAVALSQQRYPTALISMDPAHNLFDIFQIQSSDTTIDLSVNLRLEEIDPATWLKKYLKTIEEQISRSYQYLTSLGLEKNLQILRYAPGLEEYALLYAYKAIREKYAGYRYLIIDMPPTALALRFFALPQLSQIWLAQLVKMRKTILEKAKIIEDIHKKRLDQVPDRILKKLNSLMEENKNISAQFSPEGNSSLYIVMNNDKLSVEESVDIYEKFQISGLTISGFILNKAGSADERLMTHEVFRQPFILKLQESAKPLIGLEMLSGFASGTVFQTFISDLIQQQK